MNILLYNPANGLLGGVAEPQESHER